MSIPCESPYCARDFGHEGDCSHVDGLSSRSDREYDERNAELERLRAELEQVQRELETERSRYDEMRLTCLDTMNQRDTARANEARLCADNARLREALKALTLWLSRNRRHMSLANSGEINALAEWDALEIAHNNGCAALAATDPSPWLREKLMKVAEETRKATVERIGMALTREEWDAVLAAIVDGVMK